MPKFGEWDVMDPASADSYSYIFNQVREEKHSGSTNISSISRGSNSNGQKKKINSESTVSLSYSVKQCIVKIFIIFLCNCIYYCEHIKMILFGGVKKISI